MIRCYITDRRGCPDLLDNIIRRMNEVDWIQIREKDLSARELLDLVRAVIALPNPHGTKILVNGRMDVALAAGADGLHLPAGSPPPNVWRQFVSREFLPKQDLPKQHVAHALVRAASPLLGTPPRSVHTSVNAARTSACATSIHDFISHLRP